MPRQAGWPAGLTSSSTGEAISNTRSSLSPEAVTSLVSMETNSMDHTYEETLV